MNSPVCYLHGRVHLDGEMTVYTCSALKVPLLEELSTHPEVTELDLSRVLEIDTAGVQLLLSARRYLSDRGQELRVRDPSRAVGDVLELCRLGGLVTPAVIDGVTSAAAAGVKGAGAEVASVEVASVAVARAKKAAGGGKKSKKASTK